ncbi:hypothetical protein PE067_06215 [Paracoccus sp. DMF-8]|nr:hypothetical protein [Paracoccus sp. DMF-8]MDF3605775.1 hypothetical protein [Paracoccus sp. DMF-8]
MLPVHAAAKAIGGVSGYFTASFTPQALAQIDRNIATPHGRFPVNSA